MNTAHRMISIYVVAIFCILAAGCSSVIQTGNPTSASTQIENPQWVNALIEQFKAEPVGNPPQSIWRYNYQGQVVYYVPAQCCDMFSTLYDADGNVICAPNGGIDGKGDGRCEDFLAQRTQEQLVWQDPRKR